MFDTKTQKEIGSYVYCLIDPRNNQPFYVGEGKENRVFDHAEDALKNSEATDKLEIIRAILKAGMKVNHVIIRHGLDQQTALEIESAIIDFSRFLKLDLSNEVLGHHSGLNGIMSADELMRKYSAKPLEQLEDGCVIININRKYRRANGPMDIYEATKQMWVISDKRIPSIKYVLSEYRGFIVEVFEVDPSGWYKIPDENGRMRWGFTGKQAEPGFRAKYLNRAIEKKRGAANPITFKV
jgi:hypothetical protein